MLDGYRRVHALGLLLLKRARFYHPAPPPIYINFPASQHNVPLYNSTFSPSLRTIRQASSSPTKARSRLRNMSDEAYSSFLDQANQDTGASKASTQSKSTGISTKSVDTEVPAALQKVEQYYTSETDEPFEPVSLKWAGENMPSESTSAKALHRSLI